MWWIAWWAIVTLIGAVGTVASLNSVRFGRRVSDDVRAMIGTSDEARPIPRVDGRDLPAPVWRYLDRAIGERTRSVRSVRLRQSGRFRPALNGSWLPIRSVQYFRTDPPAFIWWGRVRIAPGVWIDARDRSLDGMGTMLVTAESTIAIANARGPELDQSALLRLLGELTWCPTVFLDDRYLRWSALDDHRASATLQVNGRSVTGMFEFGGDDLPARYVADRYRDLGNGKSVLTPFVGLSSDYRRIDSILVPHRLVGAWVIDGQPFEYADFSVEQIEFDRPEPY